MIMERKLELKDIAGYLPYKPCFINNLSSNKNYYYGYSNVIELINYFTISLRPLSDLYRTITHDGKEIVPIVELAKIEGCGEDEIKYNKDTFGFYCCDEEGNWLTVYNQYQLFDYLHYLKIDYRGLIESGLAISVYDLEDNPYK